MSGTNYPFPSVPPMFDQLTGASPGAGNDFFQPIGTDNAIYLFGLRFTLTTDVNANARNVKIFAGVSTNERYGIGANVVQAASTVFTYNFINGLGSPYIIAGTQEVFLSLPNLFIIHENESLEIHIDNMEAGDQITLIKFTVGQYVQQVNP